MGLGKPDKSYGEHSRAKALRKREKKKQDRIAIPPIAAIHRTTKHRDVDLLSSLFEKMHINCRYRPTLTVFDRMLQREARREKREKAKRKADGVEEWDGQKEWKRMRRSMRITQEIADGVRAEDDPDNEREESEEEEEEEENNDEDEDEDDEVVPFLPGKGYWKYDDGGEFGKRGGGDAGQGQSVTV